MKKLLLPLLSILLALFLASCASVKKVESGKNTLGERMTVHIEGAWNHMDFPGSKPAQIWTMEGVTVDQFRVYSGIQDGQAMHPENPRGSKEKNFVFRSAMQMEEVVALFEGVLTRDGSSFKLLKLAPYAFGGRKGYRFEYERVSKADNVHQLGVCFGAIDKGELFALLYQAPRLTFYPRHKDRVEAIAKSVAIN